MTPTLLVLKSETRTVVRKRTFDVRNVEGALSVIERLLSDRHTGPITIHASQGGVRYISAEDKADLPTS